MIELQATCQTLKTCCHDMLVSDSLNAIKMRFVFSDEWDGLTKTAQFTQKNNETGDFVTYNVLLDEDETAMLPNEIESGVVLVSVFGVDNIERMTTNTVAFPVMKSGFVGDGQTPIPPTPDLYQQLLMKVFNTAGSPVIGENGNWYLDNIDTGVKADWSAEQENAAASAKAAADSETAAKESAEQAAAASKAIQENQAALVEQVEKNTADLLTKAPAINCEASGPLVTVTDAASQPAVQLVTHIEPVQEGEGDPSPDNVRSISGWDSVGVNRTRKNLLPINNVNTNQSETGQVTIGNVTPGSYTLSADITKYSDDTATNTRIGLTVFYTDGTTAQYQSDVDTNNLERDGITRKKILNFTTNKNKTVEKIMIWLLDRTVATVRNAKAENAQLEQGLTATTYEPYQGQTLTADLPETVCGGTLDWGTGVLTVTHAMQIFNGTETWSAHNTSTSGVCRYMAQLNARGKRTISSDIADAVCNAYPVLSGDNLYTKNQGVATSSDGTQIVVFDSTYNAADMLPFMSRLSALSTAGNPLTIVYAIDNPYTIQLTPQQLDMLKGTNNVWSDTGDTDLVYVADTKMYIDDKIAAIAAAIVNG